MQPRVRCFRGSDYVSAWCILDRGETANEVPEGWFFNGYGKTVGKNATNSHQMGTEIDVATCRKDYPHPDFLDNIDELLKKTGEYEESQKSETKRGDYVIITDKTEFMRPLKNWTRKDAEEELLLLTQTHGCDVQLMLCPLGQPIKILKKVERTTYEIEEVRLTDQK